MRWIGRAIGVRAVSGWINMLKKNYARCAISLWAMCMMWVFSARPAGAENVILRIRTVNPSPTNSQTVAVRSYLPKPAKPEDVIDASGFEITYDMHKGQYALHQEVALNPQEVRTFQVEIRDLWTIPENTLGYLETHTIALRDQLKGTQQQATGGDLANVITNQLAQVRQRQDSAKLPGSKVVDHIRAWETDVDQLEKVRRDMGVLENMVFSAGKDPGALEGSSRARPVGGTMAEMVSADIATNEVMIRIRMANTSREGTRKIPLQKDLPPEIGPADVMDNAGLEVHFDAARQITYLYSPGIEMGPEATKVFDIRVRNRWIIAPAHLSGLEVRATNLLSIAQDFKQYTSVVNTTQGIIDDIKAVRNSKPPAALNQDYIAFIRAQNEKLAVVEAKILRLEELFRPREVQRRLPEASLLDVPRPSTRTTWIIIYIILGFLGIFSLLFFLRWYGKSKAERGPETGAPAATPAPGESPEHPSPKDEGGKVK